MGKSTSLTSREDANNGRTNYLTITLEPTIICQNQCHVMSSTPIYNALIRTHHITSRKKVAKLRAAASNHNVYALLRYGGCPGIMYCQGSEPGVRDWVAAVQRLRYKDFQLVKKPAVKHTEAQADENTKVPYGKLEEMDTVKEFGAQMESFGVWSWWRMGMGYAKDEAQP